MSRDPVANQLNDYKSTAPYASVASASNGAPVPTLTASQTAGSKGPITIQDFTLVDHLAAFDRERIPERVVHAKGAGAFGEFEVTNPEITNYCKAKMFESVGKKTSCAVRFSTVGGESGSADTARDARGYTVKFYTEEGNWDMLGNNTPIFFIRDLFLGCVKPYLGTCFSIVWGIWEVFWTYFGADLGDVRKKLYRKHCINHEMVFVH